MPEKQGPQDAVPTIPLPERPDLSHLRNQARDLVRSGQAPTLARAQFQIARLYGFASWPKLKAHVESTQATHQLKATIDAEDFELAREMMTQRPELHRARMGYGGNGPLTWLAECRIPWKSPSAARLEMARWMIANGSDIHQGGDGPLMRAALNDDRIPMMELLVDHGADVNALWAGRYPIICAPCETLAPHTLKWLLDHGANPESISRDYVSPIAMVVSTYSRHAVRRQACLEVFASSGFALPDTPVMALHRGRLDLLEAHLDRDPQIIHQRFRESEIYPPELGIKPGDGLCATPVDGSTLLHLAIEYDDLPTATWLIEHGADVNARAEIDADGFGGQAPLFHTVVTLGTRDDGKARFLLEHGADPNARTTLRKQLRHMGDPEKERMHEFPNVTPIGYARQYQEQGWVSEPAISAIAAAGGAE